MPTINSSLQTYNNFWLGFKYILTTTPDLPTDPSVLADIAGLTTVGITEVVMPTATVVMSDIPTLSTERYIIPRRITYGEMTLRAPSSRNASLWSRLIDQVDALTKKSITGSSDIGLIKTETLILAELESKSILDVIKPIAIWYLVGAQATSFTPASANTNGSGNIPLDTLTLQITSMDRI